MKRVLDESCIIALLKGNFTCACRLGLLLKEDVLLPEIVLCRIGAIVHALPDESPAHEVRHRFDRIKAELATMPWTTAVTDAFLRIRRARPDLPDFEAAVEAHAIAADGLLFTEEGEVKVEVESGKSKTES